MIYSAVQSDLTQLWMPSKKSINLVCVVIKATFRPTKEAGSN
jgi:hypothetical protein